MAERRMFTMKIIDSDAFLEMPLSTQAMYFHLCMRADDDGFVNNPRKIQKIINATDDDFKLLVAKRFILIFESGVIVIKHWRMHNLLRKDRYHETQYTEERQLLEVKQNGAYTEVGNQLATKWQPNGNQMATEDSIGKESIGEDKDTIKDSIRPSDEEHSPYVRIMSAWNELPVADIKAINPGTTRHKMLNARINEYGLDAVVDAIKGIAEAPFLLGRKTDFVITFDWFVKPNNFIKVYEGNYKENKHDKDTGHTGATEKGTGREKNYRGWTSS